LSLLDTIKGWFRREREGGAPVATAPADPDRETSTNAQVEGAVGEPYPDEE